MEGLMRSILTLAFFGGISVLIIWLQLWLSARKSPFPGVIIMVIIAVVCIGTTGWMYYVTTGYHDVKLQGPMAGNYKGEVTLRLDRDDKVVGASEVIIKDKKNQVMEAIDLDFFFLVEDPNDNAKYVKAMVKDYDVDENTPILLKDIENAYQQGNGTTNRNGLLILLLFADGPLLAIHLLKRRQLKRKHQDEELAKMKIDML